MFGFGSVALPVNDITRIDWQISKVPVADNRTSAAQLSYL
jgi:hypothetical protein